MNTLVLAPGPRMERFLPIQSAWAEFVASGDLGTALVGLLLLVTPLLLLVITMLVVGVIAEGPEPRRRSTYVAPSRKSAM